VFWHNDLLGLPVKFEELIVAIKYFILLWLRGMLLDCQRSSTIIAATEKAELL